MNYYHRPDIPVPHPPKTAKQTKFRPPKTTFNFSCSLIFCSYSATYTTASMPICELHFDIHFACTLVKYHHKSKNR